MSASSLVRDFLLAHGVDSDAADYASSLACVEDDDDDFDPEALREFIIEACPDCVELDDLFQLIERSSGGGKGGTSSPPPPPDTSSSQQRHLQVSPSALLRALELRSTKVEEEEEQEEEERGGGGGGGGGRGQRRKGGSSSCDGSDGEGQGDGAGVDSLLELFPGRGRDYLAHALRINGADASEAAAWLLSSTGSVSSSAVDGDSRSGGDRGEAAWRAAREERRRRRRAERAADEAARAALLEKFDATAVVTSGEGGCGSSGGGKGGGAPVRLWGDEAKKGSGGGGGKQLQQQRFRDGVAVTSKGEKYITIKEGEEWDGGSRGRIVLKGKRGAGGVKLAK